MEAATLEEARVGAILKLGRTSVGSVRELTDLALAENLRLTSSEIDIMAAHKYFSAHCFNAAWGLIEKKNRTLQDDEEMIRLCQASIWHWTQREDCTDKNLSIGYWQASRVYALSGQADDAQRYGQASLDSGNDAEPFFVAYAYEALARAESVAGDTAKRDEYLAEARKLTEQVTDAESRKMLEADLATIG